MWPFKKKWTDKKLFDLITASLSRQGEDFIQANIGAVRNKACADLVAAGVPKNLAAVAVTTYILAVRS